MKKQLLASLLATTLLASAGAAMAQMKPEDAIRIRQAGMGFMGWNMGKIKAQVVDGSVPFDKAQMLNAALAIKGVANSGMGVLFTPGTDMKSTSIKTKLLPDFFDPANADERGKIGKNYVEQVNKLAEVAAGGDAAAIKAQFGEVGKACKACHDKFRDEDKK